MSVQFAPYVDKQDDGLQHLVLAVDGVNCAACVHKIETSLQGNQAVRQARVNFSTRRLTLIWQGEAVDADIYAKTVENLGYRVHPYTPSKVITDSEKELKSLLLALAVAGFASGNIMLLSLALWMTDIASMGEAMRSFMHWVSALIAMPTVIFSGRPFFKSAWAALSKGRTNMDVPISVGIFLTTGMSLFETINHGEHAYFDSVVMLIFFLLIGRYLDHRARQHARSAATDLLALMAGTATIEKADNSVDTILIRDLKEGMIVRLAVGDRVPADGVILTGNTTLDTSLVTGETLPQQANEGAEIYSGVMNVGMPVRMQVKKQAEQSLLADIIRLMEKAEQGQARYVRIADRAARLYTPVVHILALATFLGWVVLMQHPWQPSLVIASTVLIITCPCALGLAVPVVQVLATSLLMKRGVMVKTGDAFERLAVVDTLLLDKTGSLTMGRPELEGAGSFAQTDLHMAATLATHSRHPLSCAILRAYTGQVKEVEGLQEIAGQGLEAKIDGRLVRLGSRAWCGVTRQHDDDKLEIWLSKEGAAPVRFTFVDPLRPDAVETIAAIKAMGIEVELISGDRASVVQSVAEALKITHYQGYLKPADKFARLEALQAAGHKVAMLGDGLNDAPVLAGADVSLSPSSAIDIAQNAADIVFMGDRLMPLLLAIKVARKSQTLVRENFALSILYNIFSVPLAMAGYITPLLAALAMSGSSLVVIANSFRLKAVK